MSIFEIITLVAFSAAIGASLVSINLLIKPSRSAHDDRR